MTNTLLYYNESDILDKVNKLNPNAFFPFNYWIVGIQSTTDEPNVFDDAFYLFKAHHLIMKTTGTTNAGLSALQSYEPTNKAGCAVIKTDTYYPSLWKPGYHKSVMPALVQCSPISYYRDWNKDPHPDQTGPLHKGIIGINFHCATYTRDTNFIKKFINRWSEGCQVCNNTKHYYQILAYIGKQPLIDYCLLTQF